MCRSSSDLCYVDQTVIEFLQRIRRLFDSSGTNVSFGTSSIDQSRSWEIIWQKIWPLVSDNICRLRLDSSQLDRLRQFSPAILRNCAKLRWIDFWGIFFFEFPAEDNAGASSDQAVAKWLITPREDGLPKMLYCLFMSEGMEGLKRAFVNASDPANFILKLWFSIGDHPLPFELKNNLTGKRLTFQQMDEYKWLLVRCPIGREEAKWAKWENEARQWELDNQWNRIFIDFKDGDIGDGMLDANDEGPSEPKK
uniref:F-box domain-containing protein n=1 Tax=Globodera pallida TaxID=36090 RepID=A0A183CL35_GLOPA